MTVMQASTCQTRLHPFAQAVFWIVAAFYAYGALVHILNIASLTGFSWPEAPSKWQVLDIGYLLVDMVVVVGLVRRSWIGIAAFLHTGHKPPDRTDAPKTVDYVTDATISRHVDKTRATNPWQNGIWF
jgi:hypothetical protein